MDTYFIVTCYDSICSNIKYWTDSPKRNPDCIEYLFSNSNAESQIKDTVERMGMHGDLRKYYNTTKVPKLCQYYDQARKGKSVCVLCRWFAIGRAHMITLIFYYEAGIFHCGIYDPVYFINDSINYIGAVADTYVTLRATALLAKIPLVIHNWCTYCYTKSGSVRCVQYTIDAEFCSMYNLYFCFLYGRNGFPTNIKGIQDTINSTYLLSSPDKLTRNICKDTLKFKLIFISFIATVLTIISNNPEIIQSILSKYDALEKNGYKILETSMYEYLIDLEKKYVTEIHRLDNIYKKLYILIYPSDYTPIEADITSLCKSIIELLQTNNTDTANDKDKKMQTIKKIERFMAQVDSNICFKEFFIERYKELSKEFSIERYTVLEKVKISEPYTIAKAKGLLYIIKNAIESPISGFDNSKLKIAGDNIAIGLVSPYDTKYPKCHALLRSQSLNVYTKNELEKRNNRTRRQNAATTIAYRPFNKRWLKSTMLGFNTPERTLYRSLIPKIIDALKDMVGNEYTILDDTDRDANQCMADFIIAYINELKLRNKHVGEPEAIAYYLLNGCSESLYSVIEKTIILLSTILLSPTVKEISLISLISRLKKFLLIYFNQKKKNSRIEQLIERDIYQLIEKYKKNTKFIDLKDFIIHKRNKNTPFNTSVALNEFIGPVKPRFIGPVKPRFIGPVKPPSNEPGLSPVIPSTLPSSNESGLSPVIPSTLPSSNESGSRPLPPPNKPGSIPLPPPNKPGSRPSVVISASPVNLGKPGAGVFIGGYYTKTRSTKRYPHSKTRSKKRRYP